MLSQSIFLLESIVFVLNGCRNQIRHIIHSGGFSLHKFCRLNCTDCKDLFTCGGVGEGNDLIVSGEDNIMLADNGTATDCVQTDFVFTAFFADTMAVIDIFRRGF